MHIYPGDSQGSLEEVYVSREKKFSEKGEEMLTGRSSPQRIPLPPVGPPVSVCGTSTLSGSVQGSVVHGGWGWSPQIYALFNVQIIQLMVWAAGTWI